MSQEGHMISCWEDYRKCHKGGAHGKGLEGWTNLLRKNRWKSGRLQANRTVGPKMHRSCAQKMNIKVFHNSKKHFCNSMNGISGNNVRKARWDQTVWRLSCESESELHHVDHEIRWQHCVNKGWLESALRTTLWFCNELERERKPPGSPVGWQWQWAEQRGRDSLWSSVIHQTWRHARRKATK